MLLVNNVLVYVLTSTVCGTENEILLVFCFCPRDYKTAFRLSTQTRMKNSHVLIIVHLFPCVAKWEQMRLRHEHITEMVFVNLRTLRLSSWTQTFSENKHERTWWMWFRCCVFLTCSQVLGLTVTVVGSGRHTHTHTLGEDSRPRLQHSWWPQAVCDCKSWRGASLMNQHHNRTAWLPGFILDAFVVFATWVIRLTLRRSFKWEEKGKCVFI